jgi:hypothetical protein
MRLAPLTRQTRLFARRTINMGSGDRLLPGQELKKEHRAIPWRRLVQLYEQRRVIAESDPYFEEVMRTAGLKNNRDFAKAWLEGNFVPDTELDDELDETAASGVESAESEPAKPTKPWAEEAEAAGPDSEFEPAKPTEPWAEVVDAGGGWYDVIAGGGPVNEKRLRRAEAEALAEDYNSVSR